MCCYRAGGAGIFGRFFSHRRKTKQKGFSPMEKQKRALAIHDISCVGRCSLTVALPILSAAGVDTGILPTAVLSTHTGGFTGYTFRDLTEDMMPIAEHWKSLDLKFDAIYTGYMGSFEQIDIVKKIIDMFRTDDTIVVVDPVMGDNGKLYSHITEQFPGAMKSLCAMADVIIPNYTEAAQMLGLEYAESPYMKEQVEAMMAALSTIGAKQAVLTGVTFDPALLGAAAVDCASGEIDYAFAPRIAGLYHGTGDVFGSAFTAALIAGNSLSHATQIAVEYTQRCCAITDELKQENRYGVDFEQALPYLIDLLD